MTDQEITFEDFQKADIRMGMIEQAERIPKSDKLLKLQIDFGKLGMRQIIAGIGKDYSPEDVEGRQVAAVVNLAPRKLMGWESHGMILAVQGVERLELLSTPASKKPFESTIMNGTRVG